MLYPVGRVAGAWKTLAVHFLDEIRVAFSAVVLPRRVGPHHPPAGPVDPRAAIYMDDWKVKLQLPVFNTPTTITDKLSNWEALSN